MPLHEKYNSPNKPTWCPGCGDFGVWGALKAALAGMNMEPDEFVIVYGVGCSGDMADTVYCHGFHALHGRALPVAEGIKIVNHRLPVICVVGDGDCYGEGMGHLIAAARANQDITVLVLNNGVYGLTTGQKSPTAPKGYQGKSTPGGVVEQAINPLPIVLSAGATFVARGFAGDVPGLTKLIHEAVVHKGFAHVDILQPCVTFNKQLTYQFYQERLLRIETETEDKLKAFSLMLEEERIPIGIFFRQTRPSFTEEILKDQSKTLKDTTGKRRDILGDCKEFM